MNWLDFLLGVACGGIALGVIATIATRWEDKDRKHRDLEFEVEQQKEWRHNHWQRETRRYDEETVPTLKRLAILENAVFPPKRRKSDAKGVR